MASILDTPKIDMTGCFFAWGEKPFCLSIAAPAYPIDQDAHGCRWGFAERPDIIHSGETRLALAVSHLAKIYT